MKGQTQAVTAVLITTVIIGSVATAYLWGTPIIEKRQSQAELQKIGDKARSLYRKIVSVRDSGEGTTEKIEIEANDKQLEIEINEKKDYIDITTSSTNPPYPIGTWSLLNAKSLQNLSFGSGSYAIKGEDKPGVVAVKPVGSPGSSLVKYRIDFRNMLAKTPSGKRLERIDLEVQGQSRSEGSSTLIISNEGTEFDSGKNRVKIGTGEKLERKRTVIQIDIR